MVIRPYDWTWDYHDKNAKQNVFDIVFNIDIAFINHFFDDADEGVFAYNWLTIMAFAIDSVQLESEYVIGEI